MEPWMATMLNIGGVGAMAVALLVLHRESIKAFREELQKERDVNERRWVGAMEFMSRHHEAMTTGLATQDKALDRILRLVDLHGNRRQRDQEHNEHEG